MQLTKAEEQIMQILWTIDEGTVQDIREKFSDVKPARTTVATILSILENKGFVDHTTNGRVNVYSSLISKDEYSKKQLFGFLKNYFNGSFSALTSFFAKESNLNVEDLDKLLEETRKELEKEQNNEE
ncbi:BlaI/MecI/CopY family transcriptional regulator [Dysgonomonas sp. 216]|uniref:BlaI/MecI/CopY family transcriptional regulator n=1 Tax=Dysgonomonas sp. 216 TaxID=2302934 RepID=UPI0013D3A092|nr:BlaI/MecI/CopY family transcriptional regulator [Dysgonomonas sp. 216]NDW19064.1 BlaI/MecI/CopY family transcriptional regulator [Dysgonomonas sp. 216]